MINPPTPEEGAVESEPSPEYLALPKSERDQMDAMIEQTQNMQNHVDKVMGIMGEPVFFMAGYLIRHELLVRNLKRQVTDLQRRLTDLEDRVS